MFFMSDKALEHLDYLLEIPITEYSGKPLYESLPEAMAALFYYIIKDHKFENGNKRTALILTLGFAFYNDIWLDIPPDNLYKLALIVAESSSKDKDKTLNKLAKLFASAIVLLPSQA